MIRSALPDVPIIYDAEALFYVRAERHLEFLSSPGERDRQRGLAVAMKKIECEIVAEADVVVCLSEDEADVARGNSLAPRPADCQDPVVRRHRAHRVPASRTAATSCSWPAGPPAPGRPTWTDSDGSSKKSFPRLRALVPWVVLRISGGAISVPSLAGLTSYGVQFEGHIPDLRALYETARVAIAPLRFGSGVMAPPLEALQYGVPIRRHPHRRRRHRRARHEGHPALAIIPRTSPPRSASCW